MPGARPGLYAYSLMRPGQRALCAATGSRGRRRSTGIVKHGTFEDGSGVVAAVVGAVAVAVEVVMAGVGIPVGPPCGVERLPRAPVVVGHRRGLGCGLRADPETRHTRGQDARRQHERAAREPVHAMTVRKRSGKQLDARCDIPGNLLITRCDP